MRYILSQAACDLPHVPWVGERNRSHLLRLLVVDSALQKRVMADVGNHGFTAGRSCHEALAYLSNFFKRSCIRRVWVMRICVRSLVLNELVSVFAKFLACD